MGLAAILAAACGGVAGGAETGESAVSARLTDAGQSECAPAECGPRPLGAEQLCADGSTAGVTGRCVAHAGGACGWEILDCPATSDAGPDGGDDATHADAGEPGDPCYGTSLPACPRECAGFPMDGACIAGDHCRAQGSKIGDECTCGGSLTWSCAPHRPLGPGCNLVCR